MRQSELQRVFLNLLGNAVKFRSPNRAPTITVDAEPEGDYWHFRVADNGIGIDSAYFDKIFQVFQRLHPRTEYEGTGIGLAFVKKAVEGQGGKVWVESVPSQGSVFHFTLLAAPQIAASAT
jgi:signal transduction histidine kinase